MSSKIVDLLSHRLKRAGSTRSAKVARGLDRPRFLYMGSKVPRGDRDTVELCIVSNEEGKKRRILSRVTVYIDDLRDLMRKLDAERPFTVQPWIRGVDFEAD